MKIAQFISMTIYVSFSSLFTLFIHWDQDIRHKLVLKTLLMPALALWIYSKHGSKGF